MGEVREEDQGADLLPGGGQEEPRAHAGTDRPVAGQDQVLQEADRGGRGLLHSTWPSTDRCRVTWLVPRRELMSMNKLLPRPRLDPALHLLHLCKMTAAKILFNSS